jgi:hypothetical protein
MIAGVVTYSSRIASVFVSRELDVVGNVELLSEVGEIKKWKSWRERA